MVEVDRNNILPLYEQVKTQLLDLIDSGELKPGDILPSEKTLEDTFSVSRVTIRRALQELAHEERIIRVPGKGSFVLTPKIEPLTALTSFSENMRAQGYVPSYKQAHITVEDVLPHIAAKLNVPENSKVVHVSRLMLADGLPMAIQDAYLPISIYEINPAYFTPEVLTNISMYKVLELELGINLYRAEEWVIAAMATPEEQKKLQISSGDILLIIERLTYSTENVPVEYVKLIYPADKYRYKVELFRPGKTETK